MRHFRDGMQGWIFRSINALRNQSALAIVFEPMADNGSIAPVCQQVFCRRQRRQQCPRADVVRGLARRQEHADRTPVSIRHRVQLGVQPALGSRPMNRLHPPFCPAGWRPSGALSGGWSRSSRYHVHVPQRPAPSGCGRKRPTGSSEPTCYRGSWAGHSQQARPASATHCD